MCSQVEPLLFYWYLNTKQSISSTSVCVGGWCLVKFCPGTGREDMKFDILNGSYLLTEKGSACLQLPGTTSDSAH